MNAVPESRSRYPGAQPFSDDDFSRRVFFGRAAASRSLADKIIANRMVVVYARSGLGKTSLLKAGVAPHLREEGYLPLFARVNDVRKDGLQSVLEAIPGEAERQGVEYVPGQTDSLWSFFKTAEFWREDLLLTPVLILDQFEELFTLQSAQARAGFLDELSYLTRGVRPPTSDPSEADGVSDHPPSVRIVLSLREDYLGFLEEAAEHIPQILDARFRLSPLDLEAAGEAIVGPAAIEDPDLETKPFVLAREALDVILDYLSQRRTRTVAETRRYVEPFQLQLVCRRIEQIAGGRQNEPGQELTITLNDVGGEAALSETLKHFYRDAIRTIADRGGRRGARRLCEDYLISPEGRRLSLEENEIHRQLNLSDATLKQLVGGRLLRSENRSESNYYELSHDALVEPILATRQRKSTIVGWSGIGAGALLLLLSSILFLIVLYYFLFEIEAATDPWARGAELIAMFIFLLALFGLVVASVLLLRGSARSLSRYSRAREAAIADSGRTVRRSGGLVSGFAGLLSGLVLILFGLLLLAMFVSVGLSPISETARSVAAAFDVRSYAEQVGPGGIGLDTIVYIISSAAVIVAGVRLFRWGAYRLGGSRRPRAATAEATLPADGRRATLHGVAKVFFGGLFLLCAVALLGFSFVVVHCGSLSPGEFPAWLPAERFDLLPVACAARFAEVGVPGELLIAFGFVIVLLIVAIPTLRQGMAAIRRRPSGNARVAQTAAGLG